MWAPVAIRPFNDNIHDLTTSLETEVPQTATRVFLLYKVSSGFPGRTLDGSDPGLGEERAYLIPHGLFRQFLLPAGSRTICAS